MAEEETLPVEEAAATETEDEEAEEDIDINAIYLEIMVARTEAMDKLLRGEASPEEVRKIMDSFAVPEATSRRRRRR